MTRYHGKSEHSVFVLDEDGRRRSLQKRTDLANHSPTGFSWGYGGSGPAQLALALLADAVDDETALEHYDEFKWDVVAELPASWTLTREEIVAWIDQRTDDADAGGDRGAVA
jgi:hypothetical protein